MINPLFEALERITNGTGYYRAPLRETIERLTNPYAMQERIYRNRVDAQESKSCILYKYKDSVQ